MFAEKFINDWIPSGSFAIRRSPFESVGRRPAELRRQAEPTPRPGFWLVRLPAMKCSGQRLKRMPSSMDAPSPLLGTVESRPARKQRTHFSSPSQRAFADRCATGLGANRCKCLYKAPRKLGDASLPRRGAGPRPGSWRSNGVCTRPVAAVVAGLDDVSDPYVLPNESRNKGAVWRMWHLSAHLAAAQQSQAMADCDSHRVQEQAPKVRGRAPAQSMRRRDLCRG